MFALRCAKPPCRRRRVRGAREQELYSAHRTQVNHDKRQLTLIGKGRNGAQKTRVIDLKPFGGSETVKALPAYVGSPFMFWHGAGEDYKIFASQFADIVRRTAKWAAAEGVAFRPFRCHDLRHLHAVNWLKDGRSIYILQKRLGRVSIKTTELYLDFLTPEEQLAVKGLAEGTGGQKKSHSRPGAPDENAAKRPVLSAEVESRVT